jgi:hypothetical protein
VGTQERDLACTSWILYRMNEESKQTKRKRKNFQTSKGVTCSAMKRKERT